MKSAISRIASAAALGASAILAAVPVQAQQVTGHDAAPDLPFTPASEDALAFSQERGALIFAYDQAAWHSTDAFLTQFDAEALGPYMLGYVVLPASQEGAFDAIYFGDFGQGRVEVARYTVRGDAVTEGGFHPADARPVLSPLAARLADARQAVLEALSPTGITICANAPANSVAIPAGDAIDVYLMTPLTDMSTIPLGGHYRFTVGASGEVTAMHLLEEGCPTALLPEITPDTVGIVLTPVEFTRAAEPSEIHVWASLMRPVPLYVDTPRSRTTWVVNAGSIRELADEDLMDAEPGAIVRP